jgi:pyrimidine deaminase RibD-like protein
MEPCSKRLSGRKPCVEHIIESRVGRVVYALAEPPVFVRCEGHEALVRAGIEVVQIPQLGSYVEEMNAPALRKSAA